MLSITYRLGEPDAPPQIAITAPAPWERVHGLAEIDAEASDDRGVARVEFYGGPEQTLLGATTAPPYRLTLDTRPLAAQSSHATTTGPLGLDALAQLDRLPELRHGVRAYQVSSHDPLGQNSDLRNYLYRRGDEYVILDVQGPGCIYNIWFTSITVFTRLRFYFDGEPTPRIDMNVHDFFRRAYRPPFLAPLVGNDTVSGGGFFCDLPISFARSCIVTTDAEPWYYHLLYHRYPPDTSISTFTGNEDSRAVREMWQHAGEDPKGWTGNRVVSGTLSLFPGETATLAAIEGAGAIASVKLSLDPATEEVLNHSWLRMYWDGEQKPSVEAPVGSFFGSGLGEAAFSGLLLGMKAGRGLL